MLNFDAQSKELLNGIELLGNIDEHPNIKEQLLSIPLKNINGVIQRLIDAIAHVENTETYKSKPKQSS